MINKINGLFPHELARQYCNRGEYDCSWYHGNWHLLKTLGVVSTSAVHEASLTALLKQAVIGMTAPRILISGSTDETLIRLAHDCCASMGIEETLTAVDLCATPLAFMQAYASEHGIELVTQHCNILDYNIDDNFDIILTHAFMGYFDERQRPQLMHKWQQLLSERGRIITIQRVRPVDSPSQVRFSATQAAQFVSGAVAAAHSRNIDDRAELDSIETAASTFAKNFTNYAITSKTALESLFFDADLVFHFLEYHHLEKKGKLSGPSVPSDAEFAHIIAEKSRS